MSFPNSCGRSIGASQISLSSLSIWRSSFCCRRKIACVLVSRSCDSVRSTTDAVVRRIEWRLKLRPTTNVFQSAGRCAGCPIPLHHNCNPAEPPQAPRCSLQPGACPSRGDGGTRQACSLATAHRENVHARFSLFNRPALQACSASRAAACIYRDQHGQAEHLFAGEVEIEADGVL